MTDPNATPDGTLATNDFWDDLLAFVEEKHVIPVVGPELCTIVVEGQEVSLYRVLAERLLAKYGLRATSVANVEPASNHDITLRPGFELNDAVSGLLQRGRHLSTLYRPIHDMTRALVEEHVGEPCGLRDLAGILDFSLFVTTTFDGLLARAINEVRFEGAALTDQIAYAPNLPKAEERDIPESIPSTYCGLLYLLGRASASGFFAADEEDVLEYLHHLLAEHGDRQKNIFTELRQRHLLLIGCNFPDWFNRFFLRLTNEKRLSEEHRPKQEFLVGCETAHDRSLTVFLECFSHNSHVYPGNSRTFVAELSRRWKTRNPPVRPGLMLGKGVAPATPGRGEIFLSYSHTDLGAAQILRGELESLIKDGVIWFDKSALHPGDEWKEQILAAIKRCDLFLPLLSASTESRTDGFFHTEWEAGIDRAKSVLGRTCLVPVVIDPEFDGNVEPFKLIPSRFRDEHFGHAPGGRISQALSQTIIAAVRELRRRRAA